MIRQIFSLLFFLTFNFTHADTFLNTDVKKTIGKVDSVKGNVVLHQNQNILIQYAKKNTPITNNIFIKTRRNSKVVIKFTKGELLTLGQNSRVYISFANKYGRVSVKLLKGRLLIQDYGLGRKNIIGSVKKSKFAYSGEYLAMSLENNKERIFTSKGNKVYKYTLSGKQKTSFEEADLNKLINKRIHGEKKLYSLKKETQPEEKKTNLDEKKIVDNDNTNLEDEINSLFGEEGSVSVSNNSNEKTDIESEIESFFGEEPKTTKQKPNQVFIDDDSERFKIDVDFMLRGVGFIQDPKEEDTVDDTSFGLEGRVGLGNKTVIGSKSSVTSAGWLEIGSRKRTYDDLDNLYDSRKERRGYLNLNEAYYQLNMDNSDFTIGKKVYRTGKGMIFSPSDRITPKDTLIPSDPLFLGNYLINFDLYLGKFDFSFVLLPLFKPNRTPPPFNRWTVLPQGADFNVTSEYPSGLAWKNLQSFFKVEATLNGWDLSLGIYNGPNPEPVVRNDIVDTSNGPSFTLVREYIPVTNINFGFSTTFQRLEIHGEILKQNASEGRDDSYTMYMIGGFYTIDEWCKLIGIDQITTVLEFTNENTHKKQSYPYYVASSSTSRLFQRSFIGSTNIQFNDRTSFTYDFHNDNKKKGRAQAYSINYTFRNSGKIKFKYEDFSGTGTSIYSIWDHNDNFSVEYRYNF